MVKNKKSKRDRIQILIENCINRIESISDEKILEEIEGYLYNKVISIKNGMIPNGTKVFIDFRDKDCPWATYKGEAIIDEFPEDQSSWVRDTGEAHYNCSVIDNNGERDTGCFFPASSIKRIIS
jgi:hypothetical protein